MNELSTEFKAKETHENAMFYYGRAEFNLYKSTMEIKEIRDERYYRELGYSNFDNYCKDHWDVGRQTMDERIQIANTFTEEDFASYNLQFGHTKTLLLSRMESEQREQVTTKGIPTDDGYKTIDEATQKEIAEYRRNAEEAKNRANQAEQERDEAKSKEKKAYIKIEELEKKQIPGPPKRIEVEKVVDNTDYETIDELNEKLEKTNNQVEKTKSEKQEIQEKLDRQQKRTKDYNEVKKELEEKEEKLLALTQEQLRMKDRRLIYSNASRMTQEVGKWTRQIRMMMIERGNVEGDQEVHGTLEALIKTLEETIEEIEDWMQVKTDDHKYYEEGEVIDAEIITPN